jgi:hypothetical protein
VNRKLESKGFLQSWVFWRLQLVRRWQALPLLRQAPQELSV